MRHVTLLLCLFFTLHSTYENGLPLYYYRYKQFTNFGDELSLKIVERIVGHEINVLSHAEVPLCNKKLLALGSLLILSRDGDVLWGTGMNVKRLDLKYFRFSDLDIRALRGPKTRQFLIDNFGIEPAEVYGDPALLMSHLFPEFQRAEVPLYPFILIPHCSDLELYPKELYPYVVYPTDPWEEVVEKITQSAFVISSSLHGIIVAESFGIPARFLSGRSEPLFKYEDYYLGTGRELTFASSIEEALQMGGMEPPQCDLVKLYEAFPFDCFPNATKQDIPSLYHEKTCTLSSSRHGPTSRN